VKEHSKWLKECSADDSRFSLKVCICIRLFNYVSRYLKQSLLNNKAVIPASVSPEKMSMNIFMMSHAYACNYVCVHVCNLFMISLCN
jgi:hypothetical protein